MRMGLYRVTLTINLDIQITEDNADVDPRPALQGDHPQSALNRAVWMWLRGMNHAERKALGLGRSVLLKKDMHVIEIKPDREPEEHKHD